MFPRGLTADDARSKCPRPATGRKSQFKTHVLRVCHKSQVLRAIVEAIAIDVMYMLVLQERAVQQGFHDDTMLVAPSSARFHQSVHARSARGQSSRTKRKDASIAIEDRPTRVPHVVVQ
jgi:hypothetical protein